MLAVWRRERDSNPRCLSTSPVFKTGSLNHSDISPSYSCLDIIAIRHRIVKAFRRKPGKRAMAKAIAPCRLSKKWLAPLFRGVHSSLAPTARPGSYARKPLLRKAFCGFDAHPPGGLLLSLRDNSPCVAKSDYSLWGLRPPNPREFFDRLKGAMAKAIAPWQYQSRLERRAKRKSRRKETRALSTATT